MPNGIASPGNTQSLPVVAQVFASHDAAVMCFSPGPRDCVVYAIRLASSSSGRLFFPFWMSRSSSRRRRRRSVIAFGFGRPLGLQSIAAFRWKWALQLCEAVLGQSEVDFALACLGVRLYSCVRVSVSTYERVRLREPERPCVRVYVCSLVAAQDIEVSERPSHSFNPLDVGYRLRS